VVVCADRSIGRSWSVLTVHRSTPHSTRPPAEVAFSTLAMASANKATATAATRRPATDRFLRLTRAARDHGRTGVAPNAIELPVLRFRYLSG